MPTIPHVEKHFLGSESVRDVVIGMADGLTVPFALAAGLSAAVTSTHVIVTAGLAEVVAGATAKGLGGYLAARTDQEHFASEERREYFEIDKLPEQEKAELREIFKSYGLQGAELDAVVATLSKDKDRWAEFMMRFELGLERPDPKRAPISAATIAASYIMGGLIPLAPYMLAGDMKRALLFSILFTGIALITFGAVKGKLTGMNPFKSGLQTLLVGGLAAGAEVAQAETQLETTQAQDIDVGVTRAQFEHALAALVGQPASTFSIPASPLNLSPPKIPVGVPSELLERRADIAAAERRTAAANAQIGFAKSAYYPTLTLSAAGGTEGSTIGNWVAWPSRFFALGPTLLETLYDAGLRHATTDQARAAYEANVAAYRQSVLTAFQEVEDNLAALRILEEESAKQQQAVESAERSTALSLNRYKGGLVTYFEVITAQSIALSDEVTAVNILTRRMNSSVLLIKALGGGWNASSLPSFASKAPSQVPAMRSDDAGRR